MDGLQMLGQVMGTPAQRCKRLFRSLYRKPDFAPAASIVLGGRPAI
jgi:hypothetical protein